MIQLTVASNAPPKMVNKQTLFSLHLLDTKYDTHEPKSSLALTTEASRSTRARGVAVSGRRQLIRADPCPGVPCPRVPLHNEGTVLASLKEFKTRLADLPLCSATYRRIGTLALDSHGTCTYWSTLSSLPHPLVNSFSPSISVEGNGIILWHKTLYTSSGLGLRLTCARLSPG